MLNVLTIGISAARHVVEVEVDAQFAYFAVVICVYEPAQRFRLLAGLMRVEMVDMYVILKHIFVVNHLIGAVRLLRKVGSHPKRVILVQLPVYTCRIGKVVVLPRHRVRTILAEYLVRFGDVLDGAVLAIVLMVIVDRAKDIDSMGTIVGTQLHLWTIEIVAQVVLVKQRRIQAQTIALLLTGTDAYHGPHLGIVLSTRVVDDLHVADVLAMQTLQFACVAHLAAINIYKR